MDRAMLWAALALAGAVPSSAKDYAVAVELPNKAMSFWTLGRETGLGIELRGRYDRVDRVDPLEPTYSGWMVRVDVSHLRSPWKTEGPVSPFLMAGLGGQVIVNDLAREPWRGGMRHSDGWTTKVLLGSVGAGVAWRPLDRAALWFRYRLDLDFRRTEELYYILTLETARPEILAVFRW